MSVLLTKSQESIRAADLLISQHKCFTTSVHCSYYSAFQRSVHVLQTTFNLTDKDIEREAAFAKVGGDSHNKVITVLFNKLLNAQEKLRATDYRREMVSLKGKRVRADYSTDVIDEPFGQAAYGQALKINKLIDHVFPTT